MMRAVTVTLTAEDEARLARVRAYLARSLGRAVTVDQVSEADALLLALHDMDDYAAEALDDTPEERAAAEYWVNSTHDASGRRLTDEELRSRVLDERPEWVATAIGRPYQATNVSDALHADPELAAALEPRELPDGRYGVVVDETLRDRVRQALRAQ